jgi:hypothetical protein
MTGQVGPRGLAILVLAGITGLLLAILGWSQRGTGLVAPSVGGLGGSAPVRTSPPARTSAPPPATATVQASPAHASPPHASPDQASPASPAQPSASASLGPLLSSEPYASIAFLVWPGTPSATAQQAMSGLVVSVTRQVGGIAVRAGVAGQPLPPARFYASGGKVYILESNLGDDSSDLDYNLGDDGLIVTNLQGRIVP